MINKIIIKLRKECSLTQKEIANKLSMSRTGYASWEQGLSEPNTSDIKKLCIIFNVTADELLEIETAEERKKIIIQ
ncbi:MAG: helix-turn-helix transcriptional regulator [Clostridia bacterium]